MADEPKVLSVEEMLQQAEAIGLKIDNRWSDATLLKNIEGLQCLTQKDNS